MSLLRYRPCTAVLVRRADGMILLVHKPRKKDAWQLPQGGIEEGENLAEAASRELKEETGIAIRPEEVMQLPHSYQYDYPPGFKRAKKPKFDGQHLTFVTVSVPTETIIRVDKQELDTFRWIQLEELGKYLKRKEYLEVVQKVIGEYGSKGVKE